MGVSLVVSPLVEFWVEVPLLGGGPPLGGGLFVRQQDEADVGVRAIFGASGQRSVGVTEIHSDFTHTA